MQCCACSSSRSVSNVLLDSIINISGVDDHVHCVSDAIALLQHTHLVHEVTCESCHGKTDHHKTMQITSTGDFVLVRLNRQKYDPVTRLPLPKDTRFVKPDAAIQIGVHGNKYAIRAIACHSGDGYKSGHWTHVATRNGEHFPTYRLHTY